MILRGLGGREDEKHIFNKALDLNAVGAIIRRRSPHIHNKLSKAFTFFRVHSTINCK